MDTTRRLKPTQLLNTRGVLICCKLFTRNSSFIDAAISYKLNTLITPFLWLPLSFSSIYYFVEAQLMQVFKYHLSYSWSDISCDQGLRPLSNACSLAAFQFAISVSVPTNPLRAKSRRASRRRMFSSLRLIFSCSISALSAPNTRPNIVTADPDLEPLGWRKHESVHPETMNPLKASVWRLCE